jgi:hypothetical protein
LQYAVGLPFSPSPAAAKLLAAATKFSFLERQEANRR